MKDELLLNVGVIVHSYAPNNQESDAEQTLAYALAWGGNAQGSTIIHPSTQRSYFVAYSHISGLAVKQSDPLVNLTRFRETRARGRIYGPGETSRSSTAATSRAVRT